MFGFIKNIFRKRYLKKDCSSVRTGLMPLSAVKSAVVIMDEAENGAEECKDKIISFFKKKNIPLALFFLDLRKKPEEDTRIVDADRTITRKDLNWSGRPSNEKMRTFSATNADMLISLVNNRNFPLAYMVRCSRAKFKTGRRQLRQGAFDLVIEDSPSLTYSQSEAFDEMLKYIDTIK